MAVEAGLEIKQSGSSAHAVTHHLLLPVCRPMDSIMHSTNETPGYRHIKGDIARYISDMGLR